jgi:hypothetical protein
VVNDKNILLTAFSGSSSELLLKATEIYETLIMPNDKLEVLFKQSQIISKISHNAGTSFCNELYLNGLKYIFQKNLDTKMVFFISRFARTLMILIDLVNKYLISLQAYNKF